MKKIFLIFISLILCGCSLGVENTKKSFDNYEHYNLNDRALIINKVYDEKNSVEDIYVIAYFTPKSDKYSTNGLFYQIAKDDYILLEILGGSSPLSDEVGIFFEGKFYTHTCENNVSGVCEYKFNKEKIDKKEFKFSFPDEDLYYSSINSINDEYMYLLAHEVFGEHNSYILKCSRKTYKCEYAEKKLNNNKLI